MTLHRTLTTTILSSLALVVAIALPARAVTTTAGQPTNAPAQALEIAPPIINLTGDPGQTINTEITLRDVSTSSLRVTTEFNDFTANGEDGTPKILLDQKDPTPYSIVKWISPIPSLTLEPKQLKKVPVTIKIPADASPGGYYGVIRFSGTPPDIDTSGVSLSASLGTLVMLRVKGDAKEQLETLDFMTTGTDGKASSLFEGIPFNFVERLKNTGNVYEQPTGRILISDIFGKPVAVVNVNLEQRNILPGTTRKFTQTLDKSGLGDRFLFGFYKAKLTLDYGNKQTVTSSLSFWVIPYKIILLAILLIIGLIIGGRIFLRRYTDRAVGKSRGKSRRR